jgi:NhaP-type Na+/H+ or K+/H+ antiporter
MPLFESALTLLAVAMLLLFATRRLGVPYPAMLALSGGCVAALPWAPRVEIEPHLALALFVAPAVMNSAFDMPPRVLLRYWLPLISLAVMLVLATTATVAWIGHAYGGMTVAAAIALGAIVAPPDAAAASAVLQRLHLPRRTLAVLQGESLLNDAVALLIFAAAVSAETMGGGQWTGSVPRLLIALPGGVLLGALVGALDVYLVAKLAGTRSSIVVQIVSTYGAWVLADRLQLSSISAVAALAMVFAHFGPSRTSARDRVSANAVWAALVFVLNVLAFLLVGLQARVILAGLEGDALWHALRFALMTLLAVTGVRIAWVMAYGAVLRRLRPNLGASNIQTSAPGVKVGILVSWCGMRGLVTLATALALPAEFQSRDLIVLSAFVVVIGTLVLQGFTIRPLIALLHIEQDCSLYEEISRVRVRMLDSAIDVLGGRGGDVPVALSSEYKAARAMASNPLRPQAPSAYDELRLEAIAQQRRVLDVWRRLECIDDDAYHRLEEELDRAELNATPRESSSLVEG